MSKTRPKRQPPPPSCKAILLCEKVIFDHFEGTYSTIGIIDQLVAFAFPYRAGPHKLFLQLTDGTGELRVSIQIRDVSEDIILARKDDQSIVLYEKLEKRNGVFNVPPFEVPRPGQYEVLVLADDQLIDRQTVTAHLYREDDYGQEAPEAPEA